MMRSLEYTVKNNKLAVRCKLEAKCQITNKWIEKNPQNCHISFKKFIWVILETSVQKYFWQLNRCICKWCKWKMITLVNACNMLRLVITIFFNPIKLLTSSTRFYLYIRIAIWQYIDCVIHFSFHCFFYQAHYNTIHTLFYLMFFIVHIYIYTFIDILIFVFSFLFITDCNWSN